MGKIIRNGIPYSGSYDDATSVNYDNSVSGLNARTVQEGVDELANGLKNTSVVDNLLSTSTTLPLSANQGRVLDEKIGTINESLEKINSYSFQKLVLESEWVNVVYERDKNYLIALHAIDGRALIGLFSTTYTEHFDILVNVGNMVCACNFDGGRFNFNNTNGFGVQFSMTKL